MLQETYNRAKKTVNIWQQVSAIRANVLTCDFNVSSFQTLKCDNSAIRMAFWHADCKTKKEAIALRAFTPKDSTMIEFRWVVLLTMWTLLIGPILDFTQSTPTVQATRAKTTPVAKTKNVP
jgi:hypothetical protein